MYRLSKQVKEIDTQHEYVTYSSTKDESETYMNDPNNHAIYDVNTIANYDPEIILLLDAPVGAAFIRTPSGLVLDPQGAPSEE